MKIDPLNILLNKDFKTNKKFYFVSGNEITLMQKILAEIVNGYQLNENASLTKIDSINEFVDEVGLFGEKKVFLVKNCKDVDEKSLNILRDNDSVFIFVQENSQKIKNVKKIFIEDKESYLFDCYELDRASKIKILNKFLKTTKINLGDNLYWFLIEKLDNKYTFLENSLNKIFQLNQHDINLVNIKKLISNDGSGKEGVFFSLLKNNREITAVYREKIINKSDVNELYYYSKFFCQLIIESINEEEYRKKIPVYLFREKNFLIDIFKRYNQKKKGLLLKLLFSYEKLLREEGDLSLISGFRFLLNIKKITIS